MPFVNRNSEYVPSDSEDEYTPAEKLMLDSAHQSKKRNEENEEGIFDIESGESEDGSIAGEEENQDNDMASDLDDNNTDDDLPDPKAWGKKKSSYYRTDYVDPDYGGTFQGDDAEAAEQEEEEAQAIQRRLAEQLFDADFTITELIPTQETDSKEEFVKTDLGTMTKRQKLDLLMKESPEFFNLINDFKENMSEVKDKLIPVLNLHKTDKIPSSPAIDFINTKFHLILNYCTNIAFYVMLKIKRSSVKEHPVIKTLIQYRQLLKQLEPVYQDLIGPQVEVLLQNRDNPVLTITEFLSSLNKRKQRKKKLDTLKHWYERQEGKKSDADESNSLPSLKNDKSDEIEENLEETENITKRQITYQMAKNKGLTPRRKKEQRNPRVKHRNKFRKATIRRRGQVRQPRQEIPYYRGEPTGIKIGVTKGIKIKA